MYHHVAIIYDDPAVARETLLFPLFLMFGANIFDGGFGERVDHAVTGAGANYEIISKRDDIFQVYQDDIFAFSVFKGVYDFACKFQCVQISPHGLVNDAENNFV